MVKAKGFCLTLSAFLNYINIKHYEKEMVGMLRFFRNKKGSEVIQNLIVIAIMGALAISAIGAISTKIKQKNNDVLDKIDTNLTSAQNEAASGN